MNGVWITRPAPANRRTAEALDQVGFRVIVVPVLEVRTVDPDPVATAWPDWLVLVSRNAGEGLMHALQTQGFPSGEKSTVKVATVGRATAEWARDRNWNVVVVPERESAAGLIEALAHEPFAGRRVWIPAGTLKGSARETLPRALEEMGALVELLRVYETATRGLSTEDLSALASLEPGAVVLHSPSAAQAVLDPQAPPEVRLWRESARLVSIGPVTTERCRGMGQTDVLECAHPTDRDLSETLQSIEALSRKVKRT